MLCLFFPYKNFIKVVEVVDKDIVDDDFNNGYDNQDLDTLVMGDINYFMGYYNFEFNEINFLISNYYVTLFIANFDFSINLFLIYYLDSIKYQDSMKYYDFINNFIQIMSFFFLNLFNCQKYFLIIQVKIRQFFPFLTNFNQFN